MKVKVTFSKGSGDIVASVTILNCEGYYTMYVFKQAEEERGSSFVRKSFPLTQEGLTEAQKWVREVITHLQKEVERWRNFTLPPDEVIEF